MANRLVIGAFAGTHVLRASRPGFNVLSTGLTPEQLAFDSRWPEAGKVIASGMISFGSADFVNVYYGATLSFIPAVIFRPRVSSTVYKDYGAVAHFLKYDDVYAPEIFNSYCRINRPAYDASYIGGYYVVWDNRLK